jgi:hypothetical protein
MTWKDLTCVPLREEARLKAATPLPCGKGESRVAVRGLGFPGLGEEEDGQTGHRRLLARTLSYYTMMVSV